MILEVPSLCLRSRSRRARLSRLCRSPWLLGLRRSLVSRSLSLSSLSVSARLGSVLSACRRLRSRLARLSVASDLRGARSRCRSPWLLSACRARLCSLSLRLVVFSLALSVSALSFASLLAPCLPSLPSLVAFRRARSCLASPRAAPRLWESPRLVPVLLDLPRGLASHQLLNLLGL